MLSFCLNEAGQAVEEEKEEDEEEWRPVCFLFQVVN